MRASLFKLSFGDVDDANKDKDKDTDKKNTNTFKNLIEGPS